MTEDLAVWLVRLALVAAAVGVVVLAWDAVALCRPGRS
jgi:hypothetical protein